MQNAGVDTAALSLTRAQTKADTLISFLSNKELANLRKNLYWLRIRNPFKAQITTSVNGAESDIKYLSVNAE